jgi:uncharacterized RDD family membrane protein YckC
MYETSTNYPPGSPPGHLDAEILSIDNVELDLPLAGVGSRLLAVCIDQMVAFLLIALLALAMVLLLPLLGVDGWWVVAAFVLMAFVAQWGYYSIAEIVMEGSTPGKAMVGLRTVSHLGGKPSVAAILVRNFIRAFDFIAGWVWMTIDRRSRRLGDLLASTLVVHYRPVERAVVRLGRMPASWGATEVAVVESFLRRAEQMEPARATDLSQRLLDWIGRRDPEFITAGETEQASAPALLRLRTLLRVESS